MFLYLLAFFVFNLVLRVTSQSFPDVLGYATNIQVERLLAETNAKRAEVNLTPLTLNGQLSLAASRKATDMFAKNYWAHVAPDGKTPWDFIVGSGYKYTVAGENLAKNFQDSTGVVNAWMASPSHRDNLLKGTYREVGFAVVNGKLLGEETTLVVQMFGTRPRPVGDAAPVVPQAPVDAPVVAQAPVVEPVVADLPVVNQQVVVPEVASVTEVNSEVAPSSLTFSSVLNLPKFDVLKVRRDATMIFGGVLIGILCVDLYLASKKRTVRAVGSSVAHVFFFLAIMFGVNFVLRGSVL